MKRRISRVSIVSIVLAGVVAGLSSATAQTSEADVKAKFEKDKTGTNPMNFTYDARIYNEYQWLNPTGSRNVTTLEFRAPFASGKWQFRAKVRGVGVDAGPVDEYGFGDTDLRVMTVPYINMQKRIALAPGLEVSIDTASHAATGSGSTSLAPFIFLAYFNPIGKGSIFVPGYQQFFSVSTDEGRRSVNWGLIDMFLVKTYDANKYWAYVDPQIILDYQNSDEYMLLEIQGGMMVAEAQSVYLMPSFGLGSDRPYDFSLELGYKVIW
jgi:hypothetical protein